MPISRNLAVDPITHGPGHNAPKRQPPPRCPHPPRDAPRRIAPQIGPTRVNQHHGAFALRRLRKIKLVQQVLTNRRRLRHKHKLWPALMVQNPLHRTHAQTARPVVQHDWNLSRLGIARLHASTVCRFVLNRVTSATLDEAAYKLPKLTQPPNCHQRIIPPQHQFTCWNK